MHLFVAGDVGRDELLEFVSSRSRVKDGAGGPIERLYPEEPTGVDASETTQAVRRRDSTLASPGARLGYYVLLELIGEGSLAHVFLDEHGDAIPFDARSTGGMPVGVPGTLAAMSRALDEYGTMSLAVLAVPAVRLARDGFVLDQGLDRKSTRLNSSHKSFSYAVFSL